MLQGPAKVLTSATYNTDLVYAYVLPQSVAFLGALLLPNTFARRAWGREPTSGQWLASCRQCPAERLPGNVCRKMKVNNFDIGVRNRAIGMIQAGMSQRDVALKVRASVRAVQRWWQKFKAVGSVADRPRSGRPSSICTVAKIVLKKAVRKRGQSATKVAQRLTRKGYPVSDRTVRRYWKNTLGLKAYKMRVRPKLTEKQRAHRIKFCKERKNWTVDDWKRVLFSDESPYALFHPPNLQNDRVWAADPGEVPEAPSVKFPPKLMVWGMMSYQGLSNLHVIPAKTSVNAEYYVETILEKCCLPAINRTRSSGSVLKRRMVDDRSTCIFMQDGAPAHRSVRAQQWCRDKLPHFWAKDVWPGNSPDLNPIEELWAIVQQDLDKQKPATNLTQLQAQLQRAWSRIKPSVLNNLVASMPVRVRTCLRVRGEYIEH